MFSVDAHAHQKRARVFLVNRYFCGYIVVLMVISISIWCFELAHLITAWLQIAREVLFCHLLRIYCDITGLEGHPYFILYIHLVEPGSK